MNRASVKRAAWRAMDRALSENDGPRKWWEIVIGVVVLFGLAWLLR